MGVDHEETHFGTPEALKTYQATKVRYKPSDMPSAIDGHTIIKEIGRGGMGVVYLAREAGWGREVALKVVPSDLTKEQVKRFLEEAFVTGQLQHPAIVPIYRMGKTTEGRDYYTMKRVQGRTLSTVLREIREGNQKTAEAFPIRRRIAILLSVCEGVAYAHDRGVVHRDLKPGNVMIGDYGEVYILDWGLAHVLFGQRGAGYNDHFDPADLGGGTGQNGAEDSNVSPRMVSGTPAYMSPESARGEPVHDQRGDVWSLGATLYQILALRPPVTGDSAHDVLQKVARNELTPITEHEPARRAPRELFDILEKALNPDPAERYHNARELTADLRDYLDGRGRWRLAYEWDVEKGELPADDWIQVLGKWRLDDEGVFPKARNASGAVLLSKKRFHGDVRVEIVGHVDHDEVEAGELSIFLCAPEPDIGTNETDGYCIQFGADWNSSAKISKNDVDMVVRGDAAPASKRRYTVAAERVGDLLRLEVDDEELLSFEDLFPLTGSRVGLYGFGAGVRVRSLRVFRRAMDAVVSCLAVPDHDHLRGRYAEALAGYRRIAEELEGREEGWMAQFKAGLSRMEANDPVGAETEFKRLDGTQGEVLAHLGRSLLSAHEGDLRRELLRLSAARRTGQGTRVQNFVQARLWDRATELFDYGPDEAAVLFFQEALNWEPPESKRRAVALTRICTAQFQCNREHEAMRTLERMFEELDHETLHNSMVLQRAINYFTDAARWNEAHKLCERIGGTDALRGYSLIALARLMIQQGCWNDGVRLLAEAEKLPLGPDDERGLLACRADILHYQGDPKRALACLNEAMTVALPDRGDHVLRQMAWLNAQQGDPDLALRIFAQGLQGNTHRNRMGILTEIGILARLQSYLDRACECFEQVLAHLPKEGGALRCNTQLELALARLALGENARAREDIQQAANYARPSISRLAARRMADWREGDPLPEPPEPGQECPWAQRPRYFFLMGEFAKFTDRRDEAQRAYHRAYIECASPWQKNAWLSVLRLKELGGQLPADAPDFKPLTHR